MTTTENTPAHTSWCEGCDTTDTGEYGCLAFAVAHFEDVPSWIEAQPWEPQQKVEAHRLHTSRAQTNLPPYTATQWSAWAGRWGKAAA